MDGLKGLNETYHVFDFHLTSLFKVISSAE